jgi:hypothetical protein
MACASFKNTKHVSHNQCEHGLCWCGLIHSFVIVGEVTSKSVTINKIRKKHRKKKQIEIFCDHHTKLCDSVLDFKPLHGVNIHTLRSIESWSKEVWQSTSTQAMFTLIMWNMFCVFKTGTSHLQSTKQYKSAVLSMASHIFLTETADNQDWREWI